MLTDTSARKGLQTRAGVLLAAWVLLLAILSLKGVFLDFSLPPRPAFAILLPLPVVLLASYSAAGKAWLRRVPAWWLIYLQAFRIAVELILWLTVRQGLLPVQMSFEGRNFDILSGVLALPVGYYACYKRSWPSWIIPAYNILGLLLLLNIVRITALSLPGPLRQFHNEPSSQLIATFPWIYLPGLLVPLAYSLHILSLRKWGMDRRAINGSVPAGSL